jgi:hypothetical protein
MKVKISKNTRVARAGKAFGEAIIENVHLLYLKDNALEYLQTLTGVLNKEFRRRKKYELPSNVQQHVEKTT